MKWLILMSIISLTGCASQSELINPRPVKLKVGDAVNVIVSREYSCVVDADGKLTIPDAGTIKAAGLTCDDVALQATLRMRKGHPRENGRITIFRNRYD
jgi:protein involved in polysaccharide export with SLBB domain